MQFILFWSCSKTKIHIFHKSSSLMVLSFLLDMSLAKIDHYIFSKYNLTYNNLHLDLLNLNNHFLAEVIWHSINISVKPIFFILLQLWKLSQVLKNWMKHLYKMLENLIIFCSKTLFAHKIYRFFHAIGFFDRIFFTKWNKYKFFNSLQVSGS